MLLMSAESKFSTDFENKGRNVPQAECWPRPAYHLIMPQEGFCATNSTNKLAAVLVYVQFVVRGSGNRGVDARFVVKGAARDRRKSEGSKQNVRSSSHGRENKRGRYKKGGYPVDGFVGNNLQRYYCSWI